MREDPNSPTSIRFLAVLIEDVGETLMREDLLWGDGAGDSKLPAPPMLGCRLCRPSAWYFYSDGSDGNVFFFEKTIEKLASLPEQGALCAGRRSIRF